MLVEFSLSCVFHHVGDFFQFMVFTFQENALNLCNFTHAWVLQSKLQVEFFEKTVSSSKIKELEETMLLYQNSIRKCEDNLEHCLFIFCMICNFSKCDGFTSL